MRSALPVRDAIRLTAVMTAPLKVAIVGYGLAGNIMHGRLLEHEPTTEVTHVVTSNAERASAAKSNHAGVTVVASFAELPLTDVDLVVVASANREHVRQAEAALRAGAHVVVDKPIAGTASEAQHLVNVAAEEARLLNVFQNRRWDTEWLTLRANEVALGAIHRLESRFERWRPEPKGAWRESTDPNDVGGHLLDFGAHLVDQALQLLGPVRAVSATVRSLRGDVADDDAFLALTHVSGAVSHLSMSSLVAAPGPRLRVLGRNATFIAPLVDEQEDHLRAGTSLSDPRWGTPSQAATPFIIKDGERQPMRLQAGDWRCFYREVAAAIHGNGPGPVPAREVVQNMRVLDAARTASREQRVVELSPPAAH